MANQRAGVDFAEHRNLVPLQILLGHFLRAPIGAHTRELAHDQPFNVRTRRFAVVGVGAVIADFRVGEDYDLAGVGGVGEDFLVTRDGGIKNNFPVTFTFCSVAFAAEDSTIFQRKDSLHCFSGEWILLILAAIPAEKKGMRTPAPSSVQQAFLLHAAPLFLLDNRAVALLTFHGLTRPQQAWRAAGRLSAFIRIVSGSGSGCTCSLIRGGRRCSCRRSRSARFSSSGGRCRRSSRWSV